MSSKSLGLTRPSHLQRIRPQTQMRIQTLFRTTTLSYLCNVSAKWSCKVGQLFKKSYIKCEWNFIHEPLRLQNQLFKSFIKCEFMNHCDCRADRAFCFETGFHCSTPTVGPSLGGALQQIFCETHDLQNKKVKCFAPSEWRRAIYFLAPRMQDWLVFCLLHLRRVFGG